MSKVKVAIVGLGNCANSLIQGVEYYKDAQNGTDIPGRMHVTLGKYHISDIELVGGFDVDASKVGEDMPKAVWAGENNTVRFSDTPDSGCIVHRGPTLDGLGKYYKTSIEESAAEPIDVAQVLRDSNANVLVSYLPVGSERATRFYAQVAIDAGTGFVNCIPAFIASDPEWAQRFADVGLPHHRR